MAFYGNASVRRVVVQRTALARTRTLAVCISVTREENEGMSFDRTVGVGRHVDVSAALRLSSTCASR